MSVQFGRWNYEGHQPAQDYIERVRATLAPYGPDSNESYSKGGVEIVYRAFHTMQESRRETQPHISRCGAVITLDGRLDNRAELVDKLRDSATRNSTDVAIASAAYDMWGTNCFAHLIGDWALCIWNPGTRELVLAKDPIGTHHLYYLIEKDHVAWSSVLDPLVLFAGKSFVLDEEYIAGWFTYFPAVHLTPYVGVHSVPPSSFVLLRPGSRVIRKYWNFDPGKQIRYRSDAEYEEHFRSVLSTAVRRRLRSDRPILAELSGGMDSSSIVCMADLVIAGNTSEFPCLDTISWYDDSNPDLDERTYFTKVEEKRGRAGYHIDLGTVSKTEGWETNSERSVTSEFGNDHFRSTPFLTAWRSERFQRHAAYLVSHGHRVTLSGIGGGEVTGDGVPSPTPELQNLLARTRFVAFAKQAKAWAAKMRKSRVPLFWEAVRGFLPPALGGLPTEVDKAPWFNSGFVRRNHLALRSYPSRMKLFGALPSFQDNILTLELTQRVLAYIGLQSEMLCERRFPYLDRSLLEFMYAIPREQIVRVGVRRSLMKRALVGIVPDELLNRKRKASTTTKLPKNRTTEWPSFIDIGQYLVSSSLGIIDQNRFWDAVQRSRYSEEVPSRHMKQTLTLESWLRHLTAQGVLANSLPVAGQRYCSPIEAKEF